MVFPHIANDGRDVVHALVVGDDDQGPVRWYGMGVFKPIACAQHVGAPHNEPVQHGYAPFVCIVPEHLQTEPLDGMKNDQYQTKKKEEKYGQGIGEQFYHGKTYIELIVKIKKPPFRVACNLSDGGNQQNSL